MHRSYLTLAIKVLLRRRVFTAVSLFGISFTLLVLVVVCAIVDQTLAPLAPETRQARTLGAYEVRLTGPEAINEDEAGYALFDRYMRELPEVERMSIFSTTSIVSSYRSGSRIESHLKRTDGDYWKILDFSFLEGGPFTASDVNEARFVAVISETTRRRFFDSAPAAGQTIEVDGQRFRVVGVVPDVSMLRSVPFADIWVPVSTAKTDNYKTSTLGGFVAIFLARSATAFPTIQEHFQSRLRQVEIPDPRTWNKLEGHLHSAMERLACNFMRKGPGRALPALGEAAQIHAFWALLSALALLFMLLPALNLVNLNVSRVLERASEVGVRKAFGASSRALVGQFLIENVVLTLVGGAFALILAPLALGALSASGLMPYARFGLNLRVFGAGFGLALVFGLLSGIYPAWRMSRLHPVSALRGGTR